MKAGPGDLEQEGQKVQWIPGRKDLECGQFVFKSRQNAKTYNTLQTGCYPDPESPLSMRQFDWNPAYIPLYIRHK